MSTIWKLKCYLAVSCLLAVTLASRCSIAQAEDVVETVRARSLFFETFDTDEWQSRWKHSNDAKYNGRFTTDAAKGWTNRGLKIPDKSKYYGLATRLDPPVDPVVAADPAAPLPLVVQYEVKYGEGVTCGGSYIKLLSADPALQPEGLVDSTPYSIMFGPDKCGATSKVHLILRHRNPLNGSVAEKHLAAPPAPETDDYTHVYTLRLHPDGSYQVLVDGTVRSSGDLAGAATLQPPLRPPREVPDPDDRKPADWVDVSEIPDPDAVKPDDWDDREMVEDDKAVRPKGWLEDEPPLINDPAAKRPDDWDDEEDGSWEPNQVPNPRCKVGCGPWRRPMKRNPAWKGAWKPPMIKNPKFQGPWVQKRIPNPDYYEEAEPLRSGVAAIGGLALELWTVDAGYVFDNVLLTRDPELAELAVQRLWKPRHEAEVKAFEAQQREKELREKERRKEEAEAKKAKKKGSKGPRHTADKLKQITQGFLQLFEDGAVLSPLAPYLAPLLDYLRDQPAAIALLLGLGPLLLLTVLLLLRGGFSGGGGGREKRAAVVVEAGDVAADAEEDNHAAEAAEAVVAAAAEGDDTAAAPAAAAEAVNGEAPAPVANSEIQADDDEDEEEPAAATGPRRRTPRAA